ncbi:adenylyl-sulfate kinase [Chloroflexota bacterium]
MVIWLMGISGAGKTTLGNRLKQYLDSLNKRAYIIDGDLVRDFFDNDLGYSREERVANIKRIMLAVHALSQNSIITIVCNIHPFEELRAFARRKIKDYNEIYLRIDTQTSRKADVKEMYKNNLGKTNIVGIDLNFDEPINCDLVIDTGGESEEESFSKILNHLENKYPESFN